MLERTKMFKLTYVGFVIALITAFMPANAGHINGGEGHGNEKDDAPVFVVMDSDPLGSKPVGTVINFNMGALSSQLQVWLEVVDSLLDTRTVVVHLTRERFVSLGQTGGSVFFELDNCDDSGGVFITDNGFLPAVESSVLLSSQPPTADPNPLYIARVGSVPATRAIRSNTGPSAGGGCQNLISNRDNLVEAELVVPDLRSVFPPPFTFEAQ